MRARFRFDDDSGFGMILVIAMSTVLLALMIVGATVADRSLQSSTAHVTYTQSLAAAESGIDQTISRLQRAYVGFGIDFPVPSNATTADPAPTCAADPSGYTVPTGGFASDSAERTWAKSKLAALLAAHPECLSHSSLGDYVVLKPANRQVVYSMGFAPSYGAPKVKTRLIKSEYLFQPYRPTNAILTGGDLYINSSTTVTTAPGSDPVLASVHSNGGITVANGNPVVYGPVSSSTDSTSQNSNKFYANTGGSVTTTPKQPLPAVSARAVYGKWALKLQAQWYDLCADGKVKVPTAAGPCVSTAAGDQLADLGPGGADAGTSFRGFTWAAAAGSSPAQWLVGKNVPDGVYYAVGSDVAPASGAGNTVTNNATIIAQSVDEDSCQKVGGNISWDHNDINAPVIPNTFMLADADLTTSSNFSAGSAGPPVVSGLFIAGDQVHMSTSSNGAYGAVIASDECPPQGTEKNEIKNPSIYYDPNGEAPFTDVINTTLWLEYTG